MKQPKIRFKGFEREWEETTIGRVASVIGGGTPSTYNHAFWNGSIQWFTPSEIGYSKYVSRSQRTITQEGLASSNAKIIPAYSILLSSRATIGEASINTCETTTNQGFQSLIPTTADVEYLYYLMMTKKGNLIRESNGSTFLEISASKVRAIEIFVPNRKEQHALGAYFQHLDTLIQSTEKKIASLTQVKEASLQAMFPHEGETMPKVRFKGFEGEWRSSTIDDIANRFDNLRIPVKESHRTKGETPYYGANGIQDYVEGYTHDGEFILVAEDGANDLDCYPVQYVNGKIWVNNHAHVLQAKSELCSTLCLKYILMCTDIKSVLVGGSRAKLNSNQLMELKVLIPSLSEQTAIASYFSSLDTQLALHRQRLEKLKQIKSACLDNMFV